MFCGLFWQAEEMIKQEMLVMLRHDLMHYPPPSGNDFIIAAIWLIVCIHVYIMYVYTCMCIHTISNTVGVYKSTLYTRTYMYVHVFIVEYMYVHNYYIYIRIQSKVWLWVVCKYPVHSQEAICKVYQTCMADTCNLCFNSHIMKKLKQ